LIFCGEASSVFSPVPPSDMRSFYRNEGLHPLPLPLPLPRPERRVADLLEPGRKARDGSGSGSGSGSGKRGDVDVVVVGVGQTVEGDTPVVDPENR
jgi:hypothetical protein